MQCFCFHQNLENNFFLTDPEIFADIKPALYRLDRELIMLQLLKACRIKFQKFAAHAHKDAFINEPVYQYEAY